MTPIFLRDLTLKSFRGVRNEMTIRLGGRLTVLVAPNGTGKTTLCNGVEWLLTGEVSGISDESELRCLTASQEADPSVTGLLELGQQRVTLERRVGKWRKQDRPGGSFADVSVTKVLGLLASDAGSQEKGQVANTIRRKWLRGTRLLLGHDLGVLLDSDPEASDARRRVLADLFGVENQEATIRKLDRYLREISPHASRAARELIDLNSELERLRRQIAKPSPVAKTELALAAECLGFANFKPSTPVDHSLDELATRHAQSLVHIQTRESALAFVRANASRMTEDTKRRQSLERDIHKTRRSESWARQWQGRVEAILQQLSKAELEAKLALHDTHEWMQELAEAWHNGMPPGFQADASLSDIDAALANNAFRLERDRKHTVEALAAQAEAVFNARRIRREIESQEAFQADGVSEAEIDALAHQVQLLQSNLQEAEDRLARVAGPLGTLRSAGLSLLKQVDLERRDCPLCGHDWQESETLRHAITAMLLKTDPAIGALEKDVATIGEDLIQHGVKLQRLRIDWDLQHRWEGAGRTIAVITACATQLGLSDDPENWRKEAELGKSWADRAQWRQDFQMTADLVGFFAAADTPLAKQVYSYLGRLGANTVLQTTSLARIRSRNDRATRLSQRLRRVEVFRAKSAVRMAQELTSIQQFLDEFSRNFETATVASTSANELDVVAVNFATEREKLARALLHLEGAKASLAHGRTMARLEECQQKVEQATTRAAQFETRRDTAIQFQKKLASHRDNFVREQMNALLPAVESLFGRMHANHVFDAICSGDGADPSLWFAEIDGKPLATANFSQGQRQDLALAIFLARACGLKGSFFLDEPFVHLDDLNRVAMLDILRAIVLSQPDIHLVLTTASRTLARHIHEKFALLDKDFLKIIELQGDPRADQIEVMSM